jgi:hypothetical protein
VLGALQFAFGWTRLSAYVNGIALCICFPVMCFLVQRAGIVGAAFSMAAMHAVMLATHLIKTHRVFLPNALKRWPGDLARMWVAVIPAVAFGLVATQVGVLNRWTSGAVVVSLSLSSLALVWAMNNDLFGNFLKTLNTPRAGAASAEMAK